MLATPPGSPVVKPAQTPQLPTRLAQWPAVQEYDIAAADTPRSDEEISPVLSNTAEVAIAREKRKMIVSAAEQWVQLKGLEVQAKVATKRDNEQQETERCRIVEENRTKQVESFAKVTETRITASHRTQREREAHRAQAIRDAIKIHGQLESQRLHSQASMRNVFEWMLASLVGAFGATATRASSNHRTKSRAVLRRGQSLSQYVSALILVAFVRHLWLNAQARRLLLWSGRLGPYLRGILGHVLKSALQILQDPFQLTEPEEKPSALAGRVEEALARLAAKRPLPAPEDAPECWESFVGPNGRTFWHNRALGIAPWKTENLMASSVVEMVAQSIDKPLLAPDIALDDWESRIGPHGQVFWHNRALGPVPWLSEAQTASPEAQLTRKKGRIATAVSSSSLRQLLANWGLNEYATALETSGYSAESLKSMDSEQADEMLKVISCTEDDLVIFRKALETWRH